MNKPSAKHTLLQTLQAKKPVLWLNSGATKTPQSLASLSLQLKDIHAAAKRLDRFAPLLQNLFPELESSKGIIESPLLAVPNLQHQLIPEALHQGRLYIKADHGLPIAGSVKARGGIYEVLVVAEQVASDAGLLNSKDSILGLIGPDCQALLAQHTISVGSTGNLGLSIGVMAAALGFRSVVHMSADAKAWKKQRLKVRGVDVVEHQGDYASAVAAGRQQASSDPLTHFVDDENSLPLFLGYSVAALRLQQQLIDQQIVVDQEHPLFVYIPCGVGGAPGGITFGLKQLFGDHVHCFFAEPVDAPCMLVALAAGELGGDSGQPQSVYDLGLKNHTEADGLAVATASQLVATMMRGLVSGIYTVEDQQLLIDLYRLHQSESVFVEPSAAASFSGPQTLLTSDQGKQYLASHHLTGLMGYATHILWTTGGAFVPEPEQKAYLHKGESLSRESQAVHS